MKESFDEMTNIQKMDKTNFTNLFASFDRDRATPRFQALRQAARERFQALPLPTPRNEDWRFTSVAPLLEIPFELPRPDETINTKHLPSQPSPGAIRLVFTNGRCLKVVSTLSDIPRGVRIESFTEMKTDPPLLTQLAQDGDSVFTALNSSFLSDGALIVIPDGAVVTQPIDLVFLTQPGAAPLFTNPRVLIVVGKNAQATVIERYLGAGAYFTNAVTEIALAEHANLDHIKLQQESPAAFHIATTQIVQAASSTFTTHYVALGGALVRNEVRVRFDGEHAESTVNGLYLAGGKQHTDSFTVIDHAKPNCASHELYKGILNDRAHGVFNGKIFVRKDAQKTDAKQTNKVLLLSDDATIDTKPQLEILADDVKCTHGATVGQLDATQLFYLRSRGIPLDAARRLLTFAFANDIVGRLKIPALREELEQRIV